MSVTCRPTHQLLISAILSPNIILQSQTFGKALKQSFSHCFEKSAYMIDTPYFENIVHG